METIALLSRSPLFRGLSQPELEALLAAAEVRAYPKGAWLLCRGQQTRRLGLVLSGTVQILREDFWGNRSMIGLAEPGDVFAESYALSGLPLEVSVLAATAVRALFLDVRQATEGRLMENLLALLAGKNLMLTEKMRHMARRTIREKLLSYLSAQALRAGGPVFDIPLDRQALADYLAVDRSAMSAVLSGLRQEGVLAFHKNHFQLLREEET